MWRDLPCRHEEVRTPRAAVARRVLLLPRLSETDWHVEFHTARRGGHLRAFATRNRSVLLQYCKFSISDKFISHLNNDLYIQIIVEVQIKIYFACQLVN